LLFNQYSFETRETDSGKNQDWDQYKDVAHSK
jgi:hypothetical protein